MDTKGKIRTLNGAQEYKQFADELVRVYQSAGKRHLELELPTLIMRTGSGQGNTTYLRLLADLMKEEHLLSFSGEEDVFEWRMLAEDEEAVHRLMLRMERAAGFYPYFSGIIGLDLSAYKDPDDLPESLFELIRESRNRVMYCLMIPEEIQANRQEALESKLRQYVRVKTIRLSASEREKSQFIQREFLRRGFLLGSNLEEPIRKLVESTGDTGYRGLRLAVDEVIWRKMARNDGLLIEGADLELCLQQGGKEKAGSRKRIIGFGACEP